VEAEFQAMLERLRRAQPAAPTPLPDDVESAARQVGSSEPRPASIAELTERFVQAAGAVGVRVLRCDVRSWTKTVGELLRERGPGLVAVFAASLPATLAPQLADLRRELLALGLDASTQPDDEGLFGAVAAVTGATALIAETGSIVCESASALPRGASLIPPLHIVVAGEDQILPDLWDYFAALARRGASLPSAVSLITGPSKTADIEGVLVTGVHGPADVCIVLVSDS
jgi:L-lactate dehydrogenase complex protein LldG